MGNISNVGSYNQRLDEILMKVDQLEQNLNEIEQFYTSANKKKLSTPKGSSVLKDKDSEKLFPSSKRRKQDAASREATSKRMQGLMCQFATILHQLDKVEMHLEELKDMVLQNCRKMSTEEKRRLSSAIAKLCPEDIDKAVEIVAQRNPDFQAAREDVEINMDAQTESTLWKLKFFIEMPYMTGRIHQTSMRIIWSFFTNKNKGYR